MADRKEPQKPLKDLLEKVYEVHRNDIKTYTSGHLNPSKLMRTAEERHSTWESSSKPPIRLKPPIEFVNYPVRTGEMTEAEKGQRRMQDLIMEFSLGPVGSTIGGLSNVHKEDHKHTATTAPTKLTSESVHVEELRLPEIMIPVAQKGKKGLEGYKSTFVESYLSQSTKADQFASFKDFGEKVINLSDANDRGVLTGEKTVRVLEKKLAKKLGSLDSSSQKGPNFHKLQIFTDIWQDVVNHTDTFGEILQRIKVEYDGYISYLLDTQRPSQHRMLYHHLDSLAQDQSTTSELKKEQDRVKTLEKEARQLLEENDRLKDVLREEEEKVSESLESVSKEPRSRAYIHVEEIRKDLEEQVNDLHAQILVQLDAIESFKRYQKEHCVPVSVCQHLEQCIKDTEVDIQKLLKRNEFLEQSIQELETELEDLLEKCGSKESDSRKLWRKINTLDVIRLGKNAKAPKGRKK